MSVFAEPRRIIDKDEAVELTDRRASRMSMRANCGSVSVLARVSFGSSAPLLRNSSWKSTGSGCLASAFLPENKRVYPNGPIAAHVLGFANLDGIGISGLEKYVDGQGLADLHGAGFSLTPDNLKPITTSLDLKATYAVRDELAKGIAKFKAKAGAAAILDVNTGEVVAMASLPDYDPNTPADALDPEPYQPAVASASMKWAQPSRRSPLRWRLIWARSRCVRGSTRATACAMAVSPFTIFTPPTGC